MTILKKNELQKNVFSKIVSFLRISRIKAEIKKNAKDKSWSTRGPLSPLKILTPSRIAQRLKKSLIFNLQGLPSLNVWTSHSYRGPQMEQLLPLPLFFVSTLISRKLQKTIIFCVHKNLNISELQ